MGASRKELSASLSYPPRAMRAEHAAAYLAMSKSEFLKLVAEGVMPAAVKIRRMSTWDRLDLDAAYDDIKLGGAPPENTVHRLLREQAEKRKRPTK